MEKETLVIISGLPDVGKSTFATRLAKELQWTFLQIDDVIGPKPDNPDIAFWDSKVAILLTLVETQLKLGLSLVVESVFMNMDRNHIQNLARKYNACFFPIYVFISNDEVWKARAEDSTDDWENIRHQRNHFKKWEPDTALFIDSINPVDQNYALILGFVKNRGMGLKPLPTTPLVSGRFHIFDK